jgi:drug/metabolite transporter (DMT)-like permease
MFGCGFLTFRVLNVGAQEPPAAATLRGWLPAFFYAAAVVGGDLAFLLATHRLPAAQANVLSYLWPVMIGLLGAAVGLVRLGVRQLLGPVLGFVGAVILLWDGHIVPSVSGCVLALTSGGLWAAYCVFRLAWKEPVGNLLARGCGLATLFCGVAHFAVEPTVVPGGVTLAATVIAGVLPMGVGYYLWDLGFKRGDSQRLAIMAYATPLCSSLLLASWGAAVLTWNLLAGAFVIVGAGMLSRSEPAAK